MLQKHRVENQRLLKAITRQVRVVALRINRADRHHIVQIAVANLLHQPLAHVARPVVILAVDHEENRSEENNEKINN